MATTEKVSVSLAVEDLEWARKRAEQDDKSLSAVLTEALRRQRQAEARRRLLTELGTDDLTEAELAAVEAEWR
ncbi:MAG: hypothetical protein RL701_2294 [Pseudomonadota bacterium]|jgi:hypothetical protein